MREVWNEIDRWLPGAGRLRGWSDRIRRTFGGAAGDVVAADELASCGADAMVKTWKV